jgi:GTPase SAR1 family protein
MIDSKFHSLPLKCALFSPPFRPTGIAANSLPSQIFSHLAAGRPENSIASDDGNRLQNCGCWGVGKIAFVQQLIKQSFNPQIQSTVGVQFRSWSVSKSASTFGTLLVKSASGRFRKPTFAGAILVFALDDQASFTDLDSWFNDLHQLASPNAIVMLVGNKADLEDARQISQVQAAAFAQRHGIEYLETSAKNGDNVADTFVRFSKTISNRVKKGEIVATVQPKPETEN